MGLFMSGFKGVFSLEASSSSEAISFALPIWVAFLGLRGDDLFSSSTTDLARPRVVRAATAGFRTGFARRPVGSATFALPFALTSTGTTFSLSGSSNFTVFLGAGLVIVVARVRGTRLAGCSTTMASSSGTSTFFAPRPRVDLAASSTGASTAALLARVGLTGGSSIGTSVSTAFLGRPRVLILGFGSIISSGSGCCSSS